MLLRTFAANQKMWVGVSGVGVCVVCVWALEGVCVGGVGGWCVDVVRDLVEGVCAVWEGLWGGEGNRVGGDTAKKHTKSTETHKNQKHKNTRNSLK